jgi:purine-binding chemotaxis protein CheW
MHARFLQFVVAGESFLAEISSVRQILAPSQPSAVPGAPSFIEGVIVYQGQAVPLIDLRSRLFPASPLPGRSLILVIATASTGTLALRVDEVRPIVTLDLDSIQPPPPVIHGLAGDLLVGVGPAEDEGIHLVLDLERVLSVEERIELAAVRNSST